MVQTSSYNGKYRLACATCDFSLSIKLPLNGHCLLWQLHQRYLIRLSWTILLHTPVISALFSTLPFSVVLVFMQRTFLNRTCCFFLFMQFLSNLTETDNDGTSKQMPNFLLANLMPVCHWCHKGDGRCPAKIKPLQWCKLVCMHSNAVARSLADLAFMVRRSQ